jgi:hypothetical protein
LFMGVGVVLLVQHGKQDHHDAAHRPRHGEGSGEGGRSDTFLSSPGINLRVPVARSAERRARGTDDEQDTRQSTRANARGSAIGGTGQKGVSARLGSEGGARAAAEPLLPPGRDPTTYHSL